jgi:ribosome-associated translation inhibitor RaiA
MTIELGDNIQLTGFRDLDSATMVVVKKMVGNFVKHIGSVDDFRNFHLTLKTVHAREKSELYELHAHLQTDRVYSAEVVERNLMVGLDSVMKKVERSMHR